MENEEHSRNFLTFEALTTLMFSIPPGASSSAPPVDKGSPASAPTTLALDGGFVSSTIESEKNGLLVAGKEGHER